MVLQYFKLWNQTIHLIKVPFIQGKLVEATPNKTVTPFFHTKIFIRFIFGILPISTAAYYQSGKFCLWISFQIATQTDSAVSWFDAPITNDKCLPLAFPQSFQKIKIITGTSASFWAFLIGTLSPLQPQSPSWPF